MADGLVNLSDQFQGLSMENLIGGPLTAAAKAEIMLANATADFINKVGFTWDSSNPPIPTTRYVDFDFERQREVPPAPAAGAGTAAVPAVLITETVKLHVPLLAIVPVPNLQVDTVDVTFDMEVKSSTSSKASNDQEIGFDAKLGIHYGPFSLDVEVQGKISSHQENTRSSDNSAKYHVAVHASNHGMPEGLARVWDIMATSISPVVTPKALTITSVNPDHGPAAGGTSSIITGTGFTGATAVNYGSTAASKFNVDSSTQITATSPAGKGAVNVVVITPAGTSDTSRLNLFTYQ
jgi:hypothetical protein